MIRNMLPEMEHEAHFFHTPPGWVEEPILGGRRTRMHWVQRDEEGNLLQSFERRVELEEWLEVEHKARGGAWLGQFVGGIWEIRARAVPSALHHVLKGLVATGGVSMLPEAKSGKAHPMYSARNTYYVGEAFPRPSTSKGGGKKEDEDAEEEEPEELADIEKERRNIARNQEILRSLAWRESKGRLPDWASCNFKHSLAKRVNKTSKRAITYISPSSSRPFRHAPHATPCLAPPSGRRGTRSSCGARSASRARSRSRSRPL